MGSDRQMTHSATFRTSRGAILSLAVAVYLGVKLWGWLSD